MIIMYLARKMTSLSVTEIGSSLMRDHSTVIHGIEEVEKNIKSNPTFENTINVLKKKINPQA